MNYSIDLAICIDMSGSMHRIIELVKSHALGFHEELTRRLEAKQKRVDRLRVKVIGFGGVYDNPPQFNVLDFVEVPNQGRTFRNFVSELEIMGGHEEGGFEALAIAMGSSWNRQQGRKRHVVMVYSDEPPHELEEGCPDLYCKWNGQSMTLEAALSKNGQPPIPRDFGELCAMWYSHMDTSARRLIVFSEGQRPWQELTSTLDNTMHIKLDVDNATMTTSIFEPLVNSI